MEIKLSQKQKEFLENKGKLKLGDDRMYAGKECEMKFELIRQIITTDWEDRPEPLNRAFEQLSRKELEYLVKFLLKERKGQQEHIIDLINNQPQMSCFVNKDR